MQFWVIVVTDPQTNKATKTPTNRQDWLQYTAPLSLARSVKSWTWQHITYYDYCLSQQVISKYNSEAMSTSLRYQADEYTPCDTLIRRMESVITWSFTVSGVSVTGINVTVIIVVIRTSLSLAWHSFMVWVIVSSRTVNLVWIRQKFGIRLITRIGLNYNNTVKTVTLCRSISQNN